MATSKLFSFILYAFFAALFALTLSAPVQTNTRRFGVHALKRTAPAQRNAEAHVVRIARLNRKRRARSWYLRKFEPTILR